MPSAKKVKEYRDKHPDVGMTDAARAVEKQEISQLLQDSQKEIAALKKNLRDAQSDCAEEAKENTALKAELETMREEHKVWEKHSLTELVKENEALKAALEKAHQERMTLMNEAMGVGSENAQLKDILEIYEQVKNAEIKKLREALEKASEPIVYRGCMDCARRDQFCNCPIPQLKKDVAKGN